MIASTKFATILAVMTREAHRVGSGVPNEYVQAIEAVNELEEFAAVVYSSNFELEVESETILRPNSEAFAEIHGRAVDGKDCQNGNPLGSADTAAVQNLATKREAGSITNRTTGIVDAAWHGVENIWGKMTGTGESGMRG